MGSTHARRLLSCTAKPDTITRHATSAPQPPPPTFPSPFTLCSPGVVSRAHVAPVQTFYSSREALRVV